MKIDVKHVAKLANLKLSEDEFIKFEQQLEETLKHIENLKEIPTENITPTNQVTGLENVTREDHAAPSLSQSDALKNTKNGHNGFFKVDAILDNE